MEEEVIAVVAWYVDSDSEIDAIARGAEDVGGEGCVSGKCSGDETCSIYDD